MSKVRHHVVQIVSNVSICNGRMEEYRGKFYSKILFSDRAFYVAITDVDIGSVKSLHTIFDKYLYHK